MRASQFFIATQKEVPADAEIVSHKLMLRAGLIRRLASGLYTWLPLGVRVLRKVEAVVREEMDRAGAQECLMPVVQPAELWEESGRLSQYGPELLRIQDRHQRPFCLGPTHEEVITDLVRRELSSYRQLPVNLYQVQTKFRDEIRPRFGVMRSREFIMKVAYSFHLDQESLQQTYDSMHQAYCRIFSRLGLEFRAVLADNGSIGGSGSHEFHVLADSGEDLIAFSDAGDYAANIEKAESIVQQTEAPEPSSDMEQVATPGAQSIEAVSKMLDIPASNLLKTLVVENTDGELVALLLRGDHQLNEIKASRLPQLEGGFQLASEDRVKSELGASVGSLGPVNLKLTQVIADHSVAALADFTCGANEDDFHLTGVNWGRDLKLPATADLRNVEDGDPSPCGNGNLQIRRGIEVGHIFQLGTKYSEAMNATVLGEDGRDTRLTMGCYGIGVTRIVAAAIEQNHDDRGIIWPDALAPFQIALIPINMHKSVAVRELCDRLYKELQTAGWDVLFMDEDKARLGVMLADTELMGIPRRLVIGDRGIENGTVEYRHRRDSENQDIAIDELLEFLQASRADS